MFEILLLIYLFPIMVIERFLSYHKRKSKQQPFAEKDKQRPNEP